MSSSTETIKPAMSARKMKSKNSKEIKMKIIRERSDNCNFEGSLSHIFHSF